MDGEAMTTALRLITKLNMNRKRMSAVAVAKRLSPLERAFVWLSRENPQALRPTMTSEIPARARMRRRRDDSLIVRRATTATILIPVFRGFGGTALRG